MSLRTFCNKALTPFLLRNFRCNPAVIFASTSSLQQQPTNTTGKEEDEQNKNNKKKTAPVPKITLISQEVVSITTLEEATKLSKRRDLKLVKLIDLDTKTNRPVYKLMSGSEFHKEDFKQREAKKKEREENKSIKGEKVVILNAGIGEHDLLIYTNKITKWIAKRYEVRFIINGNNNMQKAEEIYNYLEEKLKDKVRILQKRTKGSEIKFQMIPPKKDNKDNGDKS